MPDTAPPVETAEPATRHSFEAITARLDTDTHAQMIGHGLAALSARRAIEDNVTRRRLGLVTRDSYLPVHPFTGRTYSDTECEQYEGNWEIGR